MNHVMEMNMIDNDTPARDDIALLVEDLEEDVGLPVQGTHVTGPPCAIVFACAWFFVNA
ncbi:hypothetical protein WME79_34940 [Sorangium sp. So ce726]|uniref:hypothetical protein n=1 Tax=Sorangium sp. So ce726 TaxID=3133319 RepID=UPI003F615737